MFFATFFESILCLEIVAEIRCGEYQAVRVQVKGHAYYTGKSKFVIEDNDPLKKGFLVR